MYTVLIGSLNLHNPNDQSWDLMQIYRYSFIVILQQSTVKFYSQCVSRKLEEDRRIKNFIQITRSSTRIGPMAWHNQMNSNRVTNHLIINKRQKPRMVMPVYTSKVTFSSRNLQKRHRSLLHRGQDACLSSHLSMQGR